MSAEDPLDRAEVHLGGPDPSKPALAIAETAAFRVAESVEQIAAFAGDLPCDDLLGVYHYSLAGYTVLRSLCEALCSGDVLAEAYPSVAAFPYFAAAVQPLQPVLDRTSFELLTARQQAFVWNDRPFRCAATAVGRQLQTISQLLEEHLVGKDCCGKLAVRPGRNLLPGDNQQVSQYLFIVHALHDGMRFVVSQHLGSPRSGEWCVEAPANCDIEPFLHLVGDALSSAVASPAGCRRIPGGIAVIPPAYHPPEVLGGIIDRAIAPDAYIRTPDFLRDLERLKIEAELDFVLAFEGRKRAHALRDAPARNPAVAESSPQPACYLRSWQEILAALKLPNEDRVRDQIRQYHDRYGGPIIPPQRGGQPFVNRAKLIVWWNGIEDRLREEAQKEADLAGTVAETHPYSRTGEVVPEIGGHVRHRRKPAK